MGLGCSRAETPAPAITGCACWWTNSKEKPICHWGGGGAVGDVPMRSPLLHGEEKPLLTDPEEGAAGGAGRGEKRGVSVCTQQPEKGVLLLKPAGGKGQAPLCCWALAAPLGGRASSWARESASNAGNGTALEASWGQGPRTLSDILNGRTSDRRQKGRASTGSGPRAGGRPAVQRPSGEHASCCAGSAVSPGSCAPRTSGWDLLCKSIFVGVVS